MVNQIKIKVLPTTVPKPRKRTIKRPVIRNANFSLMQDTIVKNIKPSNEQLILEEAIKNKDFEKYNQLTKGRKDQDKRIRLDNILKAITLLKSGFNQSRLVVQEYDPTSSIVEDVEKESGDLIETLDKRFNEILAMRPRVNRLSDLEERRFDTIDREIERYSLDLANVKRLTKQLEGRDKLSSDRVQQIRDNKRIETERKGLSNKVSSLFKYGIGTRDNKELQEIFNDPTKVKAFEKEFTLQIKNGVRQLDDLENSLNDLLVKSDNIRKNKIKHKTALERMTFNANVVDATNKVYLIKTRNQIQNLQVQSMEDVRKFFELLNDDILKLTNEVKKLSDESNEAIKLKNNNNYPKNMNELIKGINKDFEEAIVLEGKILKLTEEYDQLSIDYFQMKKTKNLTNVNIPPGSEKRVNGRLIIPTKLLQNVKNLFGARQNYGYHQYIHDVNKMVYLLHNQYVNVLGALNNLSKDKIKIHIDINRRKLKDNYITIEDDYKQISMMYNFFVAYIQVAP